MAELKLIGMVPKRPKRLTTQHKFKQGDKARNSEVFLSLS